ncbi:MAG TPA: 3-methyladenine DNA glycosylase, partial [Verrucomicrobiales bacterium]|nr:3-methyladenine DNA glycosylase [Verrucomicrobiales bacterium]
LIRALAPSEGLEQMRSRRRRMRETELCSGPGKLTQALGIDHSMHGMELVHGLGLSLSRCSRRVRANTIACRRVGISREIDRKWRFVLAGSSFLSVGPGAE